MKRQHLLLTAEAPAQLRDLWDALTAFGLRFGWLDLAVEGPPAEGSIEGSLAAIAAGGALRAVGVGEAGVVVRKARRGPVVLRDLLREHFTGCQVVFVRRPAPPSEAAVSQSPWLAEAPRVSRQDDGRYRVDGESGVLELAAVELAERLRRPRW